MSKDIYLGSYAYLAESTEQNVDEASRLDLAVQQEKELAKHIEVNGKDIVKKLEQAAMGIHNIQYLSKTDALSRNSSPSLSKLDELYKVQLEIAKLIRKTEKILK